MSADLLAALRTLITGVAPILGGSIGILNTMSTNDYSNEG